MKVANGRACFPCQALLSLLRRYKYLTTVSMMLTNGIVFLIISKTNSGLPNTRFFQILTRTKPGPEFSFPEVNESRVLEGEDHFSESFDNVSGIGTDNTTLKDDERLAFSVALTPYEREAMLYVFQTFIRACNTYNVIYFLYGGSLLGSVRHHDMIPWDDDIDVMINLSDKSKLMRALKEAAGDFEAYPEREGVVKFYWVKGKPIRDLTYRWPFIDIFFYKENTRRIFDSLIEFSDFTYRKNWVFPLCHRPFAGALLPVPRCSLSAVLKTYSLSVCASLSYQHKFERWISYVYTVQCDRLSDVYPFTYRTIKFGFSNELLVKSGHIISEFKVPDTCCEFYNQEDYREQYK